MHELITELARNQLRVSEYCTQMAVQYEAFSFCQLKSAATTKWWKLKLHSSIHIRRLEFLGFPINDYLNVSHMSNACFDRKLLFFIFCVWLKFLASYFVFISRVKYFCKCDLYCMLICFPINISPCIFLRLSDYNMKLKIWCKCTL